MLALAKGARVFEKHVGLAAPGAPLNAYSATPAQVHAWLSAAARALAQCGDETWPVPSKEETSSLQSLRRGVWAERDIDGGEPVSEANVRFAFPAGPGQLTANEWSKYARFTAREPIPAGKPVLVDRVEVADDREQVLAAVERVKALLKESRIVVPGKSELEISHHYGMERFSEVGLTMVTIVNREYCKKLIVLLPGQAHPEQFHRRKEETFVVLHGEMTIWLDGEARPARAGDVITVQRDVRHRFRSEGGAVFEEISSTHHRDDSYYTDPAIGENPRRKTYLTHWM
jgi:N-acetylneuraminate synthase